MNNVDTARYKRFILGLTIAVLVVPRLVAQAGNDMSHFEVASVRLNKDRPSVYQPCTGGPGTQNPTLWVCSQASIGFLANTAFAVELYQQPLSNSLQMVDTYSISARLPSGATKEQFREMLRNLLTERFGLVWHWRESDTTVYRLVRDSNTVTLRESPPDAAPAVVNFGERPPGLTLGKDRYPAWSEGVNGLVGLNNHKRWQSSNVTAADIAYVLRSEFRTDVKDETGLTGHYDVDLHWQAEPIEALPPTAPPYDGPDAKTEFRNKLGLRLEPMKGTIRTFVIDHAEKIPTDN